MMRAAIGWAIVLVALIAAHFVILGQTVRSIPDAVMFANPAGLGVTVADVLGDESHIVPSVGAAISRPQGEQRAIDNRPYSARITAHGTITTQMPPKIAQARLIYANTISELHMLNGVFPTTHGTVAISETLAVNWFFTTNILGAEVIINGESFNIVGVYRANRGFGGGTPALPGRTPALSKPSRNIIFRDLILRIDKHLGCRRILVQSSYLVFVYHDKCRHI
jgi:hypothetical protein